MILNTVKKGYFWHSNENHLISKAIFELIFFTLQKVPRGAIDAVSALATGCATKTLITLQEFSAVQQLQQWFL